MKVAVKVAVFHQGKILCLKRSEKEEWAKGLWDLPGGRIDPEKFLIEEIKREVEEEIGSFPEGVLLPIRVWYVPEKELFGITFLLKASKRIEVKLSEEHVDFKWVGKEEVEKLKMHPGLRKDIVAAFKREQDR